MPKSSQAPLGLLLKRVSRSFYLTLRVLPAGMRGPVGLAYLLARAADTIADTSLLPPGQRLGLLASLRNQVNGGGDDGLLAGMATEVVGQRAPSGEAALLSSLGPILAELAALDEADRGAVRGIVGTLAGGMEFDLRLFPGERSGQVVALQTAEDLDRYTYMVAGCVGEFWTAMTAAHVPGALRGDRDDMAALGIRFGKALQMTNVLRDCGRDLQIGRCYVPAAMLGRLGLRPDDLLLPGAARRARPLLAELVQLALGHFRAAVEYTVAIPRRFVRLRLACLWPILIGLETLLLLVQNEDWLHPGKASKVRRRDVYGIVLSSVPLAASNARLRRRCQGLMAGIEARLGC